MRMGCWSLLLLCAMPGLAAEPPPAQTASAGITRVGDTISLEMLDGVRAASGLWSESRELPAAAKLKALRLKNPKLPPGGDCDIITQVRWADAAGKWSPWTPQNILANGDFRDGVPPGCKRHVLGAGREAERWASAPVKPVGSAVPFWRAPAAPGADVTFAAETGSNAEGGWDGVGVRLTDRAGRLVRQVFVSCSRGPNAAYRRMAAGLAVPADAAVFEGLCVLGAAAEGAAPPEIRARNGAAVFAPQTPEGVVLLSDRFADAKLWEPARAAKSEWTAGASPSLMLMAGPMHNPASAFRAEPTPFTHQGWIAVHVTATISNAEAAVTLVFSDAQGAQLPERLSLRCQGADGTYRAWACGPAPKGATHLRPVLQVAIAAGQAGTATFRSLEVRSSAPPVFAPQPPIDRVALPAPVAARRIEVRSFLLSADPKLTPSFDGYEVETE